MSKAKYNFPLLKTLTLPCFLFSIGYFLFHSTINWLLTIKLRLFDSGYMIVDFWIPILISTAFVVFYLRAQVVNSNLKGRFGDVILFVSLIGLIMPVTIAQVYIEKTTSNLTILEKPSDILTRPLTRYYSIKKSYVDKKHSGIYIKQSPVGRGNEIAVSCLFTCPLLDDTNKTNSDLWIGVVFWGKFSNRVFDDKLEQKKSIDRFIESTMTNYNLTYSYPTQYLMRQTLPDDKSDFMNSVKNTYSTFDANKIIILSVADGHFETRTNDSGEDSLIGLGLANLFWLSLGLLGKKQSRTTKAKQIL